MTQFQMALLFFFSRLSRPEILFCSARGLADAVDSPNLFLQQALLG